jgi:hypothetical protein
MATCEMTTSLGPYLLGGVELDEWSSIDGHLQWCEICQAEVVRLAGLPGLIGKIPVEEVLPRPRPSESEHSPAGRKGVARARIMQTGGALVVALAAILGVIALSRGPSPSWSHTFALVGSNPVTGVSGGASLTAEEWGTEIWVKLRGVPAGRECELVARTRQGRAVVGGTWWSTSANGAWVPATAPFQPSQIASVEIATPSERLVTLTTDVGARAERPLEQPAASSLMVGGA